MIPKVETREGTEMQPRVVFWHQRLCRFFAFLTKLLKKTAKEMTEECLPRDGEENKNEKEIKLMEFFLSATHDLRGPLKGCR